MNIIQKTSKEICFSNTGIEDVIVTANVEHPFGGQDFTLTRILSQLAPEVFLYPPGDYWEIVCIYPGDYCGQYEYTVANQTINVDSGSGIQCLDYCECSPIIINWTECGVPNSYTVSPPISCTITAPDFIIEEGPGVVWNSCRNLKGNVVVEPGGKLTIRCDVGLPENARITVEAGGVLVIDGARLYNNCEGKYWEGITVEGQNGKPQGYDYYNQTYYQGYLNIKTGSVIEYARRAVECQTAFGNNHTGGMVTARGATFRNCQVSFVHIRDFQNLSIPGLKPIGNKSSFTACNFIIDGGYYGNFVQNFREMVKLKQVEGVRFIACNFANGIPGAATPYADNRKNGITADNAGFTVTGLCSDNVPYPLPCNYTHSTFSGFNKAIYSSVHKSGRPFSVSKTDFQNNLVGIYGHGVDNAYIVDNNFHVGSDQPVSPPLFGDAANRGVHLYGCTGYKLEENRYYAYAGAGTINPVGSLVQASGEMPNELYRNFYEGLEIGNLSNGRNRHHDPTEIQGLQYRCNQNTGNMAYDFAVPTEKGANAYGVRGQQGSAAEAAGNTFSSVTSADPELHFHNKQNNITYFYYNQGSQMPTNVTPPPKVNPVNTFSVNQCLSRLPGGHEDGLLSGPEVEQFHQDANNLVNALEVRTYAVDMLIRHYQIDTVGMSLSAVRDLLVQKGDLASRFSVVDTWLQQSEPDSAQQSLAAIPSEFTLTGDSLTEYGLLDTLKTLQINAMKNSLTDSVLVAAYQTTLTGIAEAGNYHAARQAQALLNSVNGETYIPEVTLPTVEPQGLVGPPTGMNATPESYLDKAILEALPNPVKGQTVFRYCLPKEVMSGYITVTSLDGKVVASFDLEGGTGSIPWDTKAVREGIYLYTLIIDKQKVITERLAIIH